MKIFIVLYRSPLIIKKIVFYRFLISLLGQEILKFNDLENDRKNGKEVRVKKNKIDKICDVTKSWTSYWIEFINIL